MTPLGPIAGSDERTATEGGIEKRPADGGRTKAQAYAKYERLVQVTTRYGGNMVHFATFKGAAGQVLDIFSIPKPAATRGASAGPAEMPGATEVCGTLAGLLPEPFEVFTSDFFRAPIFPVKFLKKIGDFYGFGTIDDGSIEAAGVEPEDLADAGIVRHAWLSFVIAASPRFPRMVHHFTRGKNVVFNENPSFGNAAKEAHSQPLTFEPPADVSQERAASGPGAPNREQPLLAMHRPRDDVPLVKYSAPVQTQDDTRKADWVSNHFTAKKYRGEFDQPIRMLILEYFLFADQIELTTSQRAKHLINALDGPAWSFLARNYTRGMTYKDIEELMLAEYYSDSRQLQIQATLEKLEFDAFVAKRECKTTAERLDKIVQYIQILAPQCPDGFRDEEVNSKRYLRSALLKCE